MMFHLMRVSASFPFIAHEESITNSSQATNDHQLLSDGTLLYVASTLPCSQNYISPKKEHNNHAPHKK
jgi:hypothetical protein